MMDLYPHPTSPSKEEEPLPSVFTNLDTSTIGPSPFQGEVRWGYGSHRIDEVHS